MDSLLRDSVTSERFRIYTFFKFRLILILLKCTNGLVQFLKVRAIIKFSKFSFSHQNENCTRQRSHHGARSRE